MARAPAASSTTYSGLALRTDHAAPSAAAGGSGGGDLPGDASGDASVAWVRWAVGSGVRRGDSHGLAPRAPHGLAPPGKT